MWNGLSMDFVIKMDRIWHEVSHNTYETKLGAKRLAVRLAQDPEGRM